MFRHVPDANGKYKWAMKIILHLLKTRLGGTSCHDCWRNSWTVQPRTVNNLIWHALDLLKSAGSSCQPQWIHVTCGTAWIHGARTQILCLQFLIEEIWHTHTHAHTQNQWQFNKHVKATWNHLSLLCKNSSQSSGSSLDSLLVLCCTRRHIYNQHTHFLKLLGGLEVKLHNNI